MRSQDADSPAVPGHPLDADVIKLRRIRSSKARTIGLADADLHPLAEALPQGSTARRLPAGPRAWHIVQQNAHMFTLTDPRNLGTAIVLDLLRVRKRAVAAAG